MTGRKVPVSSKLAFGIGQAGDQVLGLPGWRSAGPAGPRSGVLPTFRILEELATRRTAMSTVA